MINSSCSDQIVEEVVMTWGIPTHLFLEIHVALSLIGIVTGLFVLYGLLSGTASRGWTAIFLATTILTSVTGFPLAPFGFDPPRAVGTLSLVLLAIAVAALAVFKLAGAWRWIYVVTATAALYLNCFVAVPIRAAISGRAGRGAGDLCRARLRRRAQIPPRCLKARAKSSHKRLDA